MEGTATKIMPVIDKVGRSDHTTQKQQALHKLLDVHTKIVKKILGKHSRSPWVDNSYLFCDMNAGPGSYDGIDGSPIIFTNVACSNKINYVAIFSELDQKNSASLCNTIGCVDSGVAFSHSQMMLPNSNVIGCSITDGGVTIVCNEDNSNTIQSVMDYYRRPQSKKPYGFIYGDPNGADAKFKDLTEMFNQKKFKYVDVLIHLSGTSVKRSSRCFKRDTLLDSLTGINKRYWLIQEPHTVHHWTFLLGTNWCDYPEYPSLGLVSVDSKLGREYLKQVNYTRQELSKMEENELPAVSFTPDFQVC